jgi:hypothetical protein
MTVRVGAWALILGALAFMGVFAILAARFDYPAVLDGSADTVFPRLLATGQFGRTVWALYGLLPLIWIPAGVGAYQALRRSSRGGMMVALQFAIIVAVIAAINNYLLPIWMIGFGVLLLRYHGNSQFRERQRPLEPIQQ